MAINLTGAMCLMKAVAPAMKAQGRGRIVNGVAPGLLEGTRATANLRPEFVEPSASASFLKKPADKDQCAAMVVTMCRTETMTGQTTVIDSGRVFHWLVEGCSGPGAHRRCRVAIPARHDRPLRVSSVGQVPLCPFGRHTPCSRRRSGAVPPA